MSKPTESGWYHHTNGRGKEEIVFIDFSYGFFVHKISGELYLLDDDRGVFGERILLPSEEEED